MTEVLSKEKTKTPKMNEEEVFIPFQQLWNLAKLEHEELVRSGFIHLTGCLRFPRPQPENMGRYSKMLSRKALYCVVSSQGLVFLGSKKRVLEELEYVLSDIGNIEGVIFQGKVKEFPFSDIGKRRREPLCIL